MRLSPQALDLILDLVEELRQDTGIADLMSGGLERLFEPELSTSAPISRLEGVFEELRNPPVATPVPSIEELARERLGALYDGVFPEQPDKVTTDDGVSSGAFGLRSSVLPIPFDEPFQGHANSFDGKLLFLDPIGWNDVL